MEATSPRLHSDAATHGFPPIQGFSRPLPETGRSGWHAIHRQEAQAPEKEQGAGSRHPGFQGSPRSKILEQELSNEEQGAEQEAYWKALQRASSLEAENEGESQ